jgi:hypothetical protein
MYLTPHYQHLVATAQADLYRGDPWSAVRRVQADWPKLGAAMFLRARVVRSELQSLRGRVALAAAAAAASGRTGHESTRYLIREALSAAHALDGHGLAMARGFAQTLRAGVRNLRGDQGRARLSLRGAAQTFRRCGMHLHQAAAQHAEGCLGGPAARQERARQWLAGEGVKRVPALVGMLVPACDPLR